MSIFSKPKLLPLTAFTMAVLRASLAALNYRFLKLKSTKMNQYYSMD
jgi:hypothetical protein